MAKTSYANNNFLRIRTRGQALRNPASSLNTNMNTFSVTFYGWQGETPATPASFPSLVIAGNIASQVLTYVQTDSY